MRILVLEDNDDRIHAMRDIVSDRLGEFDIRFFKSCQEMQDAITEDGLADVALISLDHDLEMLPGPEGRMIDPGTGVEMAMWLKPQQPQCPVIVQTTNTVGGKEMVRLLRHGGWHVDRVVPHDGEAWIPSIWYPFVRNAVMEAVRPNRLPSNGLAWLSEVISNRLGTREAIRNCLSEFNVQLALAAGHPGVSIERPSWLRFCGTLTSGWNGADFDTRPATLRRSLSGPDSIWNSSNPPPRPAGRHTGGFRESHNGFVSVHLGQVERPPHSRSCD
jgi:CheY-like chemotaxis protein